MVGTQHILHLNERSNTGVNRPARELISFVVHKEKQLSKLMYSDNRGSSTYSSVWLLGEM